jgi:hypothetical protein
VLLTLIVLLAWVLVSKLQNKKMANGLLREDSIAAAGCRRPVNDRSSCEGGCGGCGG